ncbi:MAG: glycosyltransferase family 4 protein [bacterium]
MKDQRRPLNICLLTYRGNPFCGGQGVYVQYLAQELVRLGHSVRVISGPPYPWLPEGVQLHKVESHIFFGYSSSQILANTPLKRLLSPLNFYEFSSSRIGVFPEIRAFSFRAYERLREMLQKETLDVIHDNQCLGYGFLLMKAFSVPLVATIHHPLSIDRRTWFETPSGLRQKIKMLLYYPLVMQRIVAANMDRIVTVSQDASIQIQRDFKIPAQRIRVVYNGLDTDVFKPLPQQQRVPKRILFVGNVADRKKGILYLLQAMAEVDSAAHLVIVDGGTPTRVSAWDLVKALGLDNRVSVTGKIGREELVRLYCSAQLAVVPSLYEGFGFPAAEAMACEVPVVATTAGALPEVVGRDQSCGTLVPPRDPHALAQALNALLAQPGKCLEMGKAGRRRVLTHFTWRKAAEQLVDIYREMKIAYH